MTSIRLDTEPLKEFIEALYRSITEPRSIKTLREIANNARRNDRDNTSDNGSSTTGTTGTERKAS